jgi:hypothetical protein
MPSRYLQAASLLVALTLSGCRPGESPTGVVARAGPGQLTVSWGAVPASALRQVDRYLVTVYPGGRSASATGTSAVVAALQRGSPTRPRFEPPTSAVTARSPRQPIR